MQEIRQRRAPAAQGPQQPRGPAAAAPARRPGRGALPLLGALAVALLALRLGVRMAGIVKDRSTAAAAAAEGGQQDAAAAADGAQQRAGEQQQQQQGLRTFTAAELSGFKGAGGGPIYMAILGDVFDVSTKPQFYGPGQGYHHFAGADGTRAFVTGEFEGEPREDTEGLTEEEVHSIVGWRDFYFKEYPHVGRVEGLYYTAAGDPAPGLAAAEAAAEEGGRLKKEKEARAQEYVSCSIKYTEAEGGRVWCKEGAYPRKLFDGMDGGAASWRCVCMDDIGWSDLLQVYPDCAPDVSMCITSPPAAAAA